MSKPNFAGALRMPDDERGLRDAGYTGVNVTLTRQVADGMHSAIIRAGQCGCVYDFRDVGPWRRFSDKRPVSA